MNFYVALQGLCLTLAIALLCWWVSAIKRDASIVDSVWSLMQLATGLIYLIHAPVIGIRAAICMVLVGVWALRLSIYITLRNWGEPEDRRYTQIRLRNEPNFVWKSIYLVFGLQAVLAWLIASPLLPIALSTASLTTLDYFAITLFVSGFLFESIGDWQLARFKRDPHQRSNVMHSGLWRYTRHPNYFGEFCMAWAIYMFAAASGAWWCLFAPLLISFLLLRVSGVTLLESDISERRPQYRDYIASTNAFFPGPPRATTADQEG